MDALASATKAGQSLWYDYIRRDLMESGELERLIKEESLRGMTSNPAIFSQAVGKSSLYDGELSGSGGDALEAFERLAVKDIQLAADAFAGVYEQAQGHDGFVSLEVDPRLAHDTQATVEAAQRLWKACGRPNVMIKIPGTEEGLPAIRECLAQGININVTLLFSVERYKGVLDAWLGGLEDRGSKGQDISKVASVASFFVSRVDGVVDKLLEEMGGQESLKTKSGLANARCAYGAFLEMKAADRWKALEAKGARAQRPLWASTSTKDPALPDTLYADALILAETVNTLPPATWEAFRGHGRIDGASPLELEASQKVLKDLAGAGISLDQVTKDLEADGVKKFEEAFSELLSTVGAKAKAVGSGA